MSSLVLPSPGSGSSEEEEAERWQEPSEIEDTKEAVSSDTRLTLRKSQAVPAWSKSVGIPVLRGRTQHELPSLAKKLSLTDIHLQKEN